MSEVSDLCALIREYECAEAALDDFAGQVALFLAFPEAVEMDALLDDWVALEEFVGGLAPGSVSR